MLADTEEATACVLFITVRCAECVWELEGRNSVSEQENGVQGTGATEREARSTKENNNEQQRGPCFWSNPHLEFGA